MGHFSCKLCYHSSSLWDIEHGVIYLLPLLSPRSYQTLVRNGDGKGFYFSVIIESLKSPALPIPGAAHFMWSSRRIKQSFPQFCPSQRSLTLWTWAGFNETIHAPTCQGENPSSNQRSHLGLEHIITTIWGKVGEKLIIN